MERGHTQSAQIATLGSENERLTKTLQLRDAEIAAFNKKQDIDQKLRFHEHAVSKSLGLLAKSTPSLGMTFNRYVCSIYLYIYVIITCLSYTSILSFYDYVLIILYMYDILVTRLVSQ